ncbi:hypothetical protein CY34DRAFT_813568 [Suillus luteus UH-Slu-Lm8-n1]|uniref:Uncharacterized protein n=1 Tax=Suillus luteus UH-Slu-Lm8-n1 TaxID=930992 RepID=A0A0C9ZVV7_9AGAM|nr:hypothetical protein CY34DRAFT_813568 [Suillus luteus UH-Slu-Lm8-n1]
MNLPHPAFTFIAAGVKDYSGHVSIDFSAVTTYHALPLACSLAGMFFDGVTMRVFIDQLLLQFSDSPDGESQLALRTFLAGQDH